MQQATSTHFKARHPKIWWLGTLCGLAMCLALLLINQKIFAKTPANNSLHPAAPIISGYPRQSSAPNLVTALQCINDTAGANDEPGQKDLTQMCVDYANAPTSISVTWNWDEISVQGANTLDACSLYDTDGDGNINFSLCATSTDGVHSTTTLYSCGDDKPDRCTSPVVSIPTPNFISTCSVSVQNTDPFAAGSQFPKDLVATCHVVLADVGATSAQLVDVCSYPSQQPNSDPSDCVVLQDNSGKLEVKKVTDPTSDPGQFNLQVDSTTKATGGNGTTTGEVVVAASNSGTNHTVGETAASGTNLSDYTTTIECKTLNGTGSVVASGTGTSITVPVHLQEDIVCTITNTYSYIDPNQYTDEYAH